MGSEDRTLYIRVNPKNKYHYQQECVTMSSSPGGRFYYESEEWRLIDHLGDWPFDPEDYGLKVLPSAPCSVGGYWADYQIQDDHLYIDTLHICTSDDNYPAINGINVAEIRYHEFEKSYRKNGEIIKETVRFDIDSGRRRYCELNILIPFTGNLLLGKDTINKYDSFARFQEYWIFKTIKEFFFEKGVLTKVYDHSYTARVAQREVDRLIRAGESYWGNNVNEFVKKNLKQDYIERAWWLG